jgi:cation/acetate symporter
LKILIYFTTIIPEEPKTINDSVVVRFKGISLKDGDSKIKVWVQNPTSGKKIMRPGLKFKIDKGATGWDKLNFISLMLALFFGTAALPHILIRYYTVPSASAARKSTIVAIGAIGLFYILTLYMGLGAMVSGVLDVESSNLSAPLLAKSFGIVLFSIISAIAFATILGTVSGLIVASSGAVAHDLMDRFFNFEMNDKQKVVAGKIAAIAIGVIAIILGILFKGMNVSYLVGWAFAVAASANLPAILMLLFWKKTTSKGIAASIFIGMTSALAIILISPKMFERYDLIGQSPISLNNPAIISVPLSFLTIVIVSLLTQKDNVNKKA